MGIIICGLNGAGKSTLGKVLAEKLNFYFIDIEDLYFPKTDPNYMYASPRTREEVERMISLSILSPIIIALTGLQLLLSNAISNILLSGFATPSSAEATIKLINFKIP